MNEAMNESSTFLLVNNILGIWESVGPIESVAESVWGNNLPSHKISDHMYSYYIFYWYINTFPLNRLYTAYIFSNIRSNDKLHLK